VDEDAPLVPAAEAARRLKAGEIVLLDVREPYELQRARVEGALHIPMRQVPGRLAELPKDKPVYVICHHGGRSQAVADWLKPQGYDVANVAGGINAWADEVDAGVGRY
jgi:adenylyltransferase/sulfurtransferase